MEFFKKNGFWIASFVLVGAMIGTWFYATGQLKTKTDSRISAISSAESSADAVMRIEAETDTRAHPNKTTEEGMNEKLGVLTQAVVAAWQKRYDAQKRILRWPERELGEMFISEFAKYSPPEKWPAEDKGDSVRIKSLLDIYKLQIPGQMNRICSIIQTNWKHQEQLSRVVNPDQKEADSDDEEKPAKISRPTRELVKWNPVNQQLWLQKLTSFKGRDDNEFQINRPSPSQVYMLQQDLWLLEAMFEIIRTVNAQMDEDGKMKMGPDGKPMMVQANDLAPVKAIDHVVFGREALALLGEIKDTITPASDQGATGLTGRSGRGGGGRGAGRTKSKASDGTLTYLGQPAFHGRYVTENLEPIPADQIRKIVNETKLPQDNLELVVAKRVPVRLAVKMDERMIPRFLAACGNSPFAFEVWQVRINKHSSEEIIKLRGSEGGATGPGGRGGRGGNGGLGGPTTGGFGGGTLDDTRKTDVKTTIALREDYVVGVEFYGIVRIYNPVNEELLTGKKDETATP